MCELARPLEVRRTARCVEQRELRIEGLVGRLVASLSEACRSAGGPTVPLVVAAELPQFAGAAAVVDALMAKRNIDTSR